MMSPYATGNNLHNIPDLNGKSFLEDLGVLSLIFNPFYASVPFLQGV